MAEKLKIIALGGLGEIGKNLTLLEYKKDIIIIDCGMGFPDNDMYGVDMVIPDVSYLLRNADKVRGMILTHGHEDHIGAVPYILKDLDIPVCATRMTAALVRHKLAEAGLCDDMIHEIEAGSRFRLGCFEVEAIHVNHSIADSVAYCITTPIGKVIHTGDFKIDPTPISGEMTDLTRLGNLGSEGVLLLLADSTNVEKSGMSLSEQAVGERMDSIFADCSKRIIVTTFASNVHRIQEIINAAAKSGRKVGVTGRSMENILQYSSELGYIDIPDGVLVEMNKLKGLPPEKVAVICTGSQGENMSALYRMAFSGHKQIEIGANDRVIISASAVPGNETTVTRVIDELFRKGAEVLYRNIDDIHASGHACRDELRILHALVKPKFFMPVHGEYRHLKLHADLALKMGMPSQNIIISDIGKVVEVSQKKICINGTVPSGKVLVDGTGMGDVGGVVLRDRKHLAQDGMLVVVVNLSAEDGSLVSGPDIISRGFVYVKDNEDLMEELRRNVIDTLDECRYDGISDWASIKSAIKRSLSAQIARSTKRTPMILPMIMEI